MSALLQYLEEKKENRGIMADLRCALVPAKCFRAYPYLGAFGGIDTQDAKQVQTIAGLFAYHPVSANTGNMGELCRKLCRKEEDIQIGAMAKRFQYLLAASRDEICDRIKGIILRAKAEGLAVNYEQLHSDLKFWNERVKTKWAAAFWGSYKEAGDAIPDHG